MLIESVQQDQCASAVTEQVISHHSPSCATVISQINLKPVQAKMVLPPQRPAFVPVPPKPPGDQRILDDGCVLPIMGNLSDVTALDVPENNFFGMQGSITAVAVTGGVSASVITSLDYYSDRWIAS